MRNGCDFPAHELIKRNQGLPATERNQQFPPGFRGINILRLQR